MHSTRRLPPLTLELRRADQAAFWTMGVVTVSTAIGSGAVAAGATTPWVWTLAGAAIVVPRLVHGGWFETGIRAWNGGVRRLAAVLRTYVLVVSYYVQFLAIAMAGSAIDRSRHAGGSRWMRRPAAEVTGGGAWLLSLHPVLFLLQALGEPDPEHAAPSSTAYTLF